MEVGGGGGLEAAKPLGWWLESGAAALLR
jgi:hypothetical protein